MSLFKNQNPAAHPAAPNGGFSPWLVAALILACVFAAYIPAIGGGFVWDDDMHVFANPHLVDLGGLWRIWFTTESQQYYPLVYSSFWLEYKLWGDAAAGYHVVNMVLHAANSLLVYLIFTHLRLRGALLAAMLFALHPVHVESVAWVSERKNVLSGLFYLSAMLSYLRYDDAREEGSANDGGARRLYITSLVLFICGLMSKTVTSSLPPALIVIRWMRGRRVGVQDVVRLLPFFAAGLAFGLVTVMWEVKFVGAQGDEFAISLIERLTLPGRVVWFYISKLFVPVDLTFIYPRWNVNAADPLQWAGSIGLVIALVALWLVRARIGRGPAAALAFFVLSLFPALGFFNVYPFRYSFVADHFQYLASLGIIGLVAGVASVVVERTRMNRTAATAVAVVVLAILGALTFSQTRIYKDLETIWRDTLEKNPTAWMAHNNLGNVLTHTGRKAEAMEHFKAAIELNPTYEVPYFNIGNELTQAGMYEQANVYYRKAIERVDGYAEAHYNLANNLGVLARFDEAAAHYARAVELRPDDVDMRINYGNTLARSGRIAEAVSQYDAALAIDPGSNEARRNREIVLRSMR